MEFGSLRSHLKGFYQSYKLECSSEDQRVSHTVSRDNISRLLLKHSAAAHGKQCNKVLQRATQSTQTTREFRFMQCDVEGGGGEGVARGRLRSNRRAMKQLSPC